MSRALARKNCRHQHATTLAHIEHAGRPKTPSVPIKDFGGLGDHLYVSEFAPHHVIVLLPPL
jgi:hypothetical protein